MARIKGVDIPDNKRVEISLTYIYGIGRSLANTILKAAGVDSNKKVKDLDDSELAKIREQVQNHLIEGDLRRSVSMHIKRLQEINSFRGMRHKRSLPCRGQRTKTNARTRRGKKGLAVTKKKTA